MNAKVASTLIIVPLAIGIGLYKRAQVVSNTTPAANGSSEDKAAQPDDPVDAFAAKLDPYIVCMNKFTRDVRQGRESWLKEFDAEKGPLPKQASVSYRLYGLSALPELKECQTGIDKVKGNEPKLPDLEKAGDAYVAALAELQPLTVKAHAYFDAGDYKDDKLKLAIELHPKLMAAWAKYHAAADPLEEQVDKLEDELQTKQLAHLEQTEGKSFHWHHKRMLVEAKKLVVFVSDARTPAEIKDLDGLQKQVAAFDTAATELLAFYHQHEKELSKRTMSYSWVESSVKNYLKSAKEMMRARRDNVKIDSEHTEGHPKHVIAAYNSLIDHSNGTRF